MNSASGARTFAVVLLALGALVAGCRAKPQTPATGTGSYSVNWEATRGWELYGQYCAVCHGPTGRGDGYNAQAMSVKPRDLTDAARLVATSDADVAAVIKNGGAELKLSPLMPAFGATLQGREADYLVAYLRTLRPGTEKPGADADASQASPAPAK